MRTIWRYRKRYAHGEMAALGADQYLSGSTPDWPERAQAHGIENLEQMQILINRIRPLEMKDHCKGMTSDCRFNFRG